MICNLIKNQFLTTIPIDPGVYYTIKEDISGTFVYIEENTDKELKSIFHVNSDFIDMLFNLDGNILYIRPYSIRSFVWFEDPSNSIKICSKIQVMINNIFYEFFLVHNTQILAKVKEWYSKRIVNLLE